MSIKQALNNILENNLDAMRQNFTSALTTKAVEKLEERKIEIAKSYFGQKD
jgi:C4-dicarboxylate-specific signal transduction histidine kinase